MVSRVECCQPPKRCGLMPRHWKAVTLALCLLAFACRALYSQPSPDSMERHLEFNDAQVRELNSRVNDIADKVSQMWGMGIAACALASGSIIFQIRKAK